MSDDRKKGHSGTAINSRQPGGEQRSQQPAGRLSAPGASVQPRAPTESGRLGPPPKPKK